MSALLVGILFMAAGILVPLPFKKNRKAALISSCVSIGIGAVILLISSIIYSGRSIDIYRAPKPFNFIYLHEDPLSEIFCILLSVLSISFAIYTPRYMEIYEEEGRERWFSSLSATFILSMYLVVLSWNFLLFVFSWEIMTLSSYFLVSWELKSEEAKKSSWQYFVAMHFLSSFPLFIALCMLLSYGSLDLSSLRITSPLFYFLFLVAFGSKAGAFPMHFWLPNAHPVAPSNVSALLSGAMIKMAVYGILRFTCYIMPLNEYFGIIVAAIGTITLTIGTLFALRQTDAKRLLAYHSVGQMGYIWLGIGAGIFLMCQSSPLREVGIIAMAAGLFHALNHGIFKGALFLSSGAMIYSSGTKDLNKLGGLGKKLKGVSFFTLIAALSIAGVPPLNGFVSKWLIYQVTFSTRNGLLALFGIFALFISAATLASFIKFYSSAFSGEEKIKIRKVPKSMTISEGILSSLCIFLGIFPYLALKLLILPGESLLHSKVSFPDLFLTLPNSSYYSPLIFSAIIGIIASVSILCLLPKRKPSEAWTLGEPVPNTSYKMTPRNYYHDFEEGIEFLYRSFEKIKEWSIRMGRAVDHGSSKISDAIFGLADKIYAWGRQTASTQAISKISDAIFGLADKIYNGGRMIGRALYMRSREIKLDEIIFSPIINYMQTLLRFIPKERDFMNALMIVSSIFLGVIVAILLLGGVRT